MAAGYDPKKAAVFNQLRQQGVGEDAAIAQAGITDAEIENYAIGTNGQLGAFIIGFPASGRLVDNSQIQTVDYDEKADAPVSSKTPTNYTTTSTTTVSGGGTTTIIAGEDQPTAASRAFQPAIDTKQAEIEQFNRDNPSNFARRKLGLPPLTPEENQKRNEQALALSQQKVELANQQASAMIPGTPTVITEPNTTTTTVSTVTGTTSVNTQVQSPDGPDPVLNQQADVNLGTTYNTYNEPGLFDPRQDVGESVFDPAAALPNPSLISAAPINDPYAGLTSNQIKLLGGADPTDPYIRARLGIPQLTDSPLAANASFGTVKTGVPILDTAISSLGNLFGFNNTKTGTTTGLPAPTPDTAATAQAAAAVRVQDPALTDDEDQNLQNIVGAQGEIVRAEENIQSNNRQILANEESQAAAQEQQRQAQAIIDQNNAELADDNLPDDRRAELEANNAAQRASIAENAAVIDEAQTNIDNATANTEQQQASIEVNQTVVVENSEAFVANGDELGAPVDVDVDAAIAAAAAEGTDAPLILSPQEVDDEIAAAAGTDAPLILSPQEVDDEIFNAAVDPVVESETTLTILSEEETNALFDGAEPGLVDSFVEVDATATELTEAETEALFAAEQPVVDQNFIDANDPVGPGDNDPFEQARLEAELAAEVPANEIVLTADEQAAADDPFEARRLELEQEANRQELAEQATDVEPTDDPFEQRRLELEQEADQERAVELTPEELAAADDPFEQRRLELEQEANRQELAEQATEVEPTDDPFEARRLELEREADEQEANRAAGDNVNSTTDPALPGGLSDEEILARQNPGGLSDEEILARQEAASKQRAQEQATLQARYKQPASSDWRVRLQLAPNADYLYKDRTGSTILAPLYETDGVIFPYTPSIETTYNANYEMYDLTHSNFRGYFYKNSRVNDINIRATFTAQDTQEANYLLAVIHFFRSVTKMFYGAKDALRGAPPPLTYLSGLGQYQFNQHPCVISQFNYSLPNDVDYIRAGAPNNYGTNLLTQRARTGAISPEAGNPSLTRLLGTITKPPVGATATPPSPSMINQNVNNLAQATYVPTKIEISLTLLPINTRSQVSTQFNMKDFASGALIKGGFW
jgi:hypothetical protein